MQQKSKGRDGAWKVPGDAPVTRQDGTVLKEMISELRRLERWLSG